MTDCNLTPPGPDVWAVRRGLLAARDEKYRDFSSSLIPGVRLMIGVRLPRLRAWAREIIRHERLDLIRGWERIADEGVEELYMEELLLWGMSVGGMKCPVERKLELVEHFVPMIDNWSVCDSSVWRLREEEREPFWAFVRVHLMGNSPYEVRFALVMALRNFADREHFAELAALLGRIRTEHYYVRMGVAWCVAELYIRCREECLHWLGAGGVEEWTLRQAVRKICDSRRVSPAEKEQVRRLLGGRTC